VRHLHDQLDMISHREESLIVAGDLAEKEGLLVSGPLMFLLDHFCTSEGTWYPF
jgi:hypothetical protein